MKALQYSFCVLALLLCAFGTIFAQEPSLFMSKQDFTLRSQLADREPWARADLAHLLKEADDFPHSYTSRFGIEKPDPPPEGGQWLHWYVCPDTGTPLQFHPPDQNICPDSGKNFPGYPFNRVVYQLRNDALGKAALTLALAYRFTDKRQYAEEAASILRSYSQIYPHYKLHDNNGKPTPNGARAYSQTLDESIWLIKLAWTYDLIRGANVLSSEDKKHFESDVLRASAATVMKAHKEPTDNIQAWINGAIAAVGYTLNDQSLIHEAIDGPIGFRYQMSHFVQEGFWIEGAWGYQFYAMRPLTMTAQMAARKGTNLWVEEPALLTLFHGPLGVVLPDGQMPAFNDNGSVNLYDQDYLYEVAYAATHDSTLLPVLEHGARTDREAFLFGVEKLPKATSERLTSKVFPKAGYAALRSSTSDLTAIMKFGPFGGAHGHFDKLNFVLFSHGLTLAIDPGSQLYGLPLHREWDKMTIAHNTISVDQQRQGPATGKLLQWHTEPGWTAVRADAGDVYKSASLQRTMLLTPEYVLIVDHAESRDGKPHIFDWAYHNSGIESLQDHVAMHAYTAFPDENGYGHLMKVREGTTSGGIHLKFISTGKGDFHGRDSNSVSSTDRAVSRKSPPPPPHKVTLDLQALPAPGTNLFIGEAPGPDLRIPIPFVVIRRTGTSVNFVTLLATSIDGADRSSRRSITIHQQSAGTYQIDGYGFSDTFSDSSGLKYRRQPR